MIAMPLKTKAILALGCLGLVALSIPALSRPSPRDFERDRQYMLRGHQQLRPAQLALRHRRARLSRGAARDTALIASPLTTIPARPTFGWPALVTEARKYIGTNPTDRSRLWCARFMNLVLAKAGYTGTGSDAAKSFAHYGRRVSGPEVGAIAVLTRGRRGGHVGVVTGLDARGNPIIVSGNHGRRVAESVYPRRRVIAYVMPADAPRGAPATRLAQMLQRPTAPPSTETPEEALLALLGLDERVQARAQPAPQQPAPHRVVQQVPYRVVQQGPLPPQRVAQQAAQTVRGGLPFDPQAG